MAKKTLMVAVTIPDDVEFEDIVTHPQAQAVFAEAGLTILGAVPLEDTLCLALDVMRETEVRETLGH